VRSFRFILTFFIDLTEMVSLFCVSRVARRRRHSVRQYRVCPSESHPAQSVPIDREGEDISQVAAVEFFEREGAQVRGCGRDGGFGVLLSPVEM